MSSYSKCMSTIKEERWKFSLYTDWNKTLAASPEGLCKLPCTPLLLAAQTVEDYLRSRSSCREQSLSNLPGERGQLTATQSPAQVA